MYEIFYNDGNRRLLSAPTFSELITYLETEDSHVNEIIKIELRESEEE